jgi:FlaA1/EpsC-like NDP-sugar epimerase
MDYTIQYLEEAVQILRQLDQGKNRAHARSSFASAAGRGRIFFLGPTQSKGIVMAKILVTGGAGFVGSHIVDAFLAA